MRFASRLGARSALAATVCWVLVIAVAGSTDVLLFLVPALLILAPLMAGRYVGESLVLKLAGRDRRRRPRASRVRPLPKAPVVWSSTGTSLIALLLAERPPPAATLSLT